MAQIDQCGREPRCADDAMRNATDTFDAESRSANFTHCKCDYEEREGREGSGFAGFAHFVVTFAFCQPIAGRWYDPYDARFGRRETMTGLRFHPVPDGREGEWVRVKSIVLIRAG